MNLKQIFDIFCDVLVWVILIPLVIFGLICAFRVRNAVRPKGETKKKRTIKEMKEYLIAEVWSEVKIYGSLPDLDWTQRFKLLLYGPATILLFVIALILWIISPTFGGLLLAVWFLISLLSLLFYTLCTEYSEGVDEGYKVAREPQPKTIEIRNTWPAHIYHACKTLVLLSFVIFFFPWFIVYRLGKWKGRRDYHIQVKEYSEPTDETEVDELRKFRDSRAQHYVFVHQMLRGLFFDAPDKIIAILRDEGRNNSLLNLWDKVGEEVGKLSLVAADGLCCEIKIHNGTTIPIITLPTPQALTEAYFVALVYRPSSDRKAPTRFITLERSVGSPPALCEWDGIGIHSNYDYSGEPTLEAFFEAVVAFCD